MYYKVFERKLRFGDYSRELIFGGWDADKKFYFYNGLLNLPIVWDWVGHPVINKDFYKEFSDLGLKFKSIKSKIFIPDFYDDADKVEDLSLLCDNGEPEGMRYVLWDKYESSCSRELYTIISGGDDILLENFGFMVSERVKLFCSKSPFKAYYGFFPQRR